MAIRPSKRVTAAGMAVSAFLLIAALQAQVSAPLSEVKVTVVDQSGAVIADSEVVFKSDSKTIVSHTGSDGSVALTLPSGRYDVTANHLGFLKGEIPDFPVTAPEPRDLRMVLKVDPKGLDCGPCGCNGCSVLVPTTLADPDPPNIIRSEAGRDSPAQPVAKKIHSARCLYLWKCSAS
jgi:hypothetical protein